MISITQIEGLLKTAGLVPTILIISGWASSLILFLVLVINFFKYFIEKNEK